MPRAGFYAVESGKISFRRDGNWYTDEERIDHPRIALLFSQSIRRADDGSYFLQVGDERAAITVEDTPYVIRTLEDDDELRRRYMLVIPVGAIGGRELELATSPAKLGRFLAEALDRTPVGRGAA